MAQVDVSYINYPAHKLVSQNHSRTINRIARRRRLPEKSPEKIISL